FRDQEFSSDMNSRSVKRIEDVRMLRARQFAEDAGPTAHPIRPDSYIEINNFYTLTVYEKGAEVIRVLHTILGEANFRKGMDLYFERHDGQAVTCEDFVAAMEDASGIDLTVARNWYSQAGTPTLHVEMEHDAAAKTCTVHFSQSTPATPGQDHKDATHIPIAMALLGDDGQPLALNTEGVEGATETVFDLKTNATSLVFNGIDSAPVPSLLRGFSAPVKLHYNYSAEQLAFLMANDGDAFNRWDAAQQLVTRVALDMLEDNNANRSMSVPGLLLDACASLLDSDADDALLAEALSFPGVEVLGDSCVEVDIHALHQVREHLLHVVANHLASPLQSVYERCTDTGPFSISAEAIGRRSLKNTALRLLSHADSGIGVELANAQFAAADNMTDEVAALRVIIDDASGDPQPQIDAFYAKWRNERLVMDKWFAMQATSTRDDTLQRVEALKQHPDYEIQNPNRVRSLWGAFAMANPVRFHARDGAAYVGFADHVIELDAINPQIAARLVGAISRWRRHANPNRDAMATQLKRIHAVEGLSNDVLELVDKSLQ
ncbi:MAG: DUF3458 domain-containing protein, partial [Pseudomonadota bacterium]